jgi:hypothetical protein
MALLILETSIHIEPAIFVNQVEKNHVYSFLMTQYLVSLINMKLKILSNWLSVFVKMGGLDMV